jgi:alanyl-tRNA synthetase
LGKNELTTIFSSDPDRYYRVSLFDELGFDRQRCNNCGKFFWALKKKLACPDHENYEFLGNPPTSKRLDYIDAWKEIQSYFRLNAHTSVSRYPVVCRWRDDLYFTIASIVDFQRVIGNKVIFELPANPLIVPQICLRFNDIENVGLTGRHYTSFCMVGQVCDADTQGGYWKDKCIELDFGMLTNALGIRQEEITFVEDVWMGAGAFGCSLEYFVSGLELGNAVFTEFEGNSNDYRVMTNKIIDMGAGLERLSWITMGTPTSYDCSFGPVVQKLVENSGGQNNSAILSAYFQAVSKRFDSFNGDVQALKCSVAKELKVSSDELAKVITPQEAIYTIADHTRTLTFAISDGALPSNVGGGYNLRVILRRALSIMERLGWSMKLEDIADAHIDYMKDMYPELEEHREEIRTILQIETRRFVGSKERMDAIATSIKTTKKELTVDDLIKLYDSDGVTPDFLVDLGILASIPPSFYTKLAELHTNQTAKNVHNPVYGIDSISPTRLLYYEDPSIREFNAKVLKVVNKSSIILDQTAFYPRGGGQEPDTGDINGLKVIEVIKQSDVVIHKLQSPFDFTSGNTVHGIVNDRRRELITKHHTATHVLNTAARINLGSWVWQNSAFKDENYARLDITHHSSLNNRDVERIEQTANRIIRQNLPVRINIYDRVEAERDYSFRIYQGGAAPTNNLRIVNTGNWDIEACGGTHANTTGELGLIKITKSERIQDGVVRLEFVAGEAAISYIQKQDLQLHMISQTLGSSKEKVVDSLQKTLDDSSTTKKKAKHMLRRFIPLISKSVSKSAVQLYPDGLRFYHVNDDELDEEYHISVGERSIEDDPSLIYLALISKGEGIRVIVFVGEEAQKKISAGVIAKRISADLGGSGGGNSKFGQGGGKLHHKKSSVLFSIEDSILKFNA